MQKIVFIVNPVSGNGAQRHIQEWVRNYLDHSKFEPVFQFTEAPKHASELAKIASQNYKYIVAVGGDGSVNEVAKGIIGTDSVLGIIPFGSGNGLARYLNIPMSPKKAIELLAKETIKTIDTLLINNELSVNVAGAGFDGYIAHKFAGLQDRGFKAYINLTLHEYWNYRPNTYEIIIDGKSTLHEALLVSVANSSQFGNNAHIAPLAKVDDGIFDITVIRPTPLYYAPVMATRLFAKNLQNSRYYTGYKCKEATIRSKQPIFGHIDGEAVELGTEIKIRIQPASLQILVGK